MKRHKKHPDNSTGKLQYFVKCVAMLLFLGSVATLGVVSVNTDSYSDHTTEASQKIETLAHRQKQLPRLKSAGNVQLTTTATTDHEGVEQQTKTAQIQSLVTTQGIVLTNGNTAGAIGTEAAARMAAATGVPQATWEYIIARESNGDPTVVNPSGAAGLFQTIPGWGSTATVEDQIQTAIRVYNAQGLAAWELQ